ncbi:hypothetical protein PILCRDRAFT_817035 [Piloderma croceum F 1598]|uniref:Uncharacterized protein n=1 Tax=Piloderma croceum (strain F 1598) TaxID=765440 RepID=A0A0C3FPA9_PILCF|nr:hypothetical protein PILCRDRAFT_817035 [Piloderma croceum F 1598]
MRATPWRAPSPPPTITDTKSEARSTVDVGTSYKRPKPDNSDGGGRVGRKGLRKRTKKYSGDTSGGAKDRSGGSDAHQSAKGEGKAHARGRGGDEAKESLDSLALDQAG